MTHLHLTILLVAVGISTLAEPAHQHVTCEDAITATAKVTPKLDVPFFHSSSSSFHWWIVEDEHGNVEDTMDGVVDAHDLLREEHTADCISSHQGDHPMNFCDAIATDDGATLEFTGGMPAYASALTVTLDNKLGYRCSFSAAYPSPTNQLKWKITKKELRLKSPNLKARSRIYGWLSVTFEEIDDKAKVTKTHKVEGHFKPVLQNKAS